MPRNKKKIDVRLSKAKSPGEAMNYIFIGLKYFLIHHTFKTCIVLGIMLSGPCYIAWQYYTSDMVKIKEAEPVEAKPTSSIFSLIPMAYASEPIQTENRIIIDGKLYGYYDSNIQVWKLKDSDIFLLYDKTTNRIWNIELPLTKTRK